MFDSEKLLVYAKAKDFNIEIKNEVLLKESLDRISKNQLRRAAMSVMLNIAEDTSRFSNADLSASAEPESFYNFRSFTLALHTQICVLYSLRD